MRVAHIRFPDGHELYTDECTHDALSRITRRWQRQNPGDTRLATYTMLDLTEAEYHAIPATNWAHELTTDPEGKS